MALEFSEELGLQADLSVEGSILRYLPSLLVQLKIYRACFLPEYRLYITLQAVEECHSIATERRLSLRSKTIFGVSTAVTELKQKEKKISHVPFLDWLPPSWGGHLCQVRARNKGWRHIAATICREGIRDRIQSWCERRWWHATPYQICIPCTPSIDCRGT